MPMPRRVDPVEAMPLSTDDPALERLRLYLRRLDPAGEAALADRLAAIAARADARAATRPGLDRTALLLEEARRLVEGEGSAAAPGPALPAEAPRPMPEQRLRYHAPLRALRAWVAGLLAPPASKTSCER